MSPLGLTEVWQRGVKIGRFACMQLSDRLKDLSETRVAYIEDQASKCHDFTLESRQIIRSEAVTTLQWYFGIIVGGCGYLVTILRSEKFGEPSLAWLGGPIVFAILVAISTSVWLMKKALLATEVFPRGNEPRSYFTPGLELETDHWIRCCDLEGLQRRIEENRRENKSVGRVLNCARLILAALPPATILLVFIWRAAAWILARFP